MGSIPGLGRSPGEGHGNPLQYSCWRIPMDRGAWRTTVRRVSKSQTQLTTKHSIVQRSKCHECWEILPSHWVISISPIQFPQRVCMRWWLRLTLLLSETWLLPLFLGWLLGLISLGAGQPPRIKPAFKQSLYPMSAPIQSQKKTIVSSCFKNLQTTNESLIHL